MSANGRRGLGRLLRLPRAKQKAPPPRPMLHLYLREASEGLKGELWVSPSILQGLLDRGVEELYDYDDDNTRESLEVSIRTSRRIFHARIAELLLRLGPETYTGPGAPRWDERSRPRPGA